MQEVLIFNNRVIQVEVEVLKIVNSKNNQFINGVFKAVK